MPPLVTPTLCLVITPYVTYIYGDRQIEPAHGSLVTSRNMINVIKILAIICVLQIVKIYSWLMVAVFDILH